MGLLWFFVVVYSFPPHEFTAIVSIFAPSFHENEGRMMKPLLFVFVLQIDFHFYFGAGRILYVTLFAVRFCDTESSVTYYWTRTTKLIKDVFFN